MRAYYNEFDPGAAAWLRQLIADGLITTGDVDDRSITDVQPADLVGYDRVHFFAGIGGWDHALTLADWGDRPVWTGSCPCQPFSAAGKRKGVADERHLWPEFFRLIRECRPECVFGEQVSGALGWLDLVSADLEGEGYACGAVIVGAHSVGAPHIRQRLYWVADAQAARWGAGRAGEAGDGRDAPRLESAGLRDALGLADAGRLGGQPDRHDVGAAPGGAQGEAQQREWLRDDARAGVATGGVGITCRQRGAAGLSGSDTRQEGDAGEPEYAGPQEPGFWDGAEFLPCRDGTARPTQPGIRPLAHGVSGRVGLLRGAGNAIVPQVAAAFIAAYRDANEQRP